MLALIATDLLEGKIKNKNTGQDLSGITMFFRKDYSRCIRW